MTDSKRIAPSGGNMTGGREVSLVVAVDRGWGIGNKGKLLAHIREDMKSFRAITMGKTVILGSKTLSTFPNGKPLKNRRNIILSRRNEFTVEDAEIAHSAEQAISMLGDNESTVIIGGESIYRLFLPYCDTAYVTKFHAEFTADTFFPNLDKCPSWVLISESAPITANENDSPNDITYSFCVYKRTKQNNMPYTSSDI